MQHGRPVVRRAMETAQLPGCCRFFLHFLLAEMPKTDKAAASLFNDLPLRSSCF
jgi:hypothetical protein